MIKYPDYKEPRRSLPPADYLFKPFDGSPHELINDPKGDTRINLQNYHTPFFLNYYEPLCFTDLQLREKGS